MCAGGWEELRRGWGAGVSGCQDVSGGEPEVEHGPDRLTVPPGTLEVRLPGGPVRVFPPGCNGDGTRVARAGERGRTGCLHHFAPGRNMAAEGCCCPAWFDSGGWHVITVNASCRAHDVPGEETS